MRAAAVASVASGFACTSLAGLSGGVAEAGRAEGGSTLLTIDAGRPDATPHDTGVDTRHDADVSRGEARDARPAEAAAPHDSGHDARRDATPDVALGDCAAYTPPDAGSPPVCPPIDGNACIPSVPDFDPVYHPPTPRSTACTVDLVSEFIGACFGPDSSGVACTAFGMSAPGCYDCLITSDETGGALGPIIYQSAIGTFETNLAGCVALVDPCESDCARVLDAQRQCFEQACSNCSVTPDWYQCQQVAGGCSCGPIGAQANDCQAELGAKPADQPCFASGTFAQVAQSYGVYFCAGGPLAWDAGADAS